MEFFAQVRCTVQIERLSRREAARRFGIDQSEAPRPRLKIHLRFGSRAISRIAFR